MCVLRYKEGGKLKTAFGTTLNKNITNPDSFLLSLGIAQSELSTVCTGEGEIIECDFGNNKLWYVPELNAIIFGKEGIQLDGSIIDSITDFFQDLFGIESGLSDQSKFVIEAQNFNEVYVLNKDGKKIRAIKEIYPGFKQTLIAEYENFNTPVCSYAQNLELPLELQSELLEEVNDMDKLECNQEGNIQRIEMIAGLDFFWPQLTGKIRGGSFE